MSERAAVLFANEVFYRAFADRDLAAMVAERDSLLQLLGSVSRADDVRAAAATLANDGRHWCDCDRLTVFQSRGRRLAAVAMSGVDGLDRRATQVRELEQLARKALHDADAANAVVWSAHNEIFDDYADLSGARWVSIAPLRDGGGALVGALAAEMLQADPPPHVEPRVARLAEETQGLFALSATSWRNAPAALRVPIEFLRSLRSVRRFVCCSVICVAMAGLLAAPANFSIDAQGEAQPVNQHDLFAPADAEVVSIEVAHNQCVLAGQVLLRLDSAMLDFEWERLRGEMRTVDSEYMAAQATRTVPASERSPNEGSVWSARLAQLRARRDGLQRQLDLLAVRRESLVVRSPAAGRVLTWEIDRRLQTRPVARGQRLLSIAEVDGPWQVELRLPDNLLGHLEASRDSHHLRYRLATAPAVEQTAVITEIAGSVTSIDGGRPMARLVAPLGRSRQLTHPGVTVTGHIDCGRRPLGFVWFHEIIDFVRARWL